MISLNAIEYVTQDLFKGKSLKSACKRFIKKFGGQDAVFIGKVDYSEKELYDAVMFDKAKTVSKFEYLPSVAMRFKIDLKELETYFSKLHP